MCRQGKDVRIDLLCFDQYNCFCRRTNGYVHEVLTKYKVNVSSTEVVVDRTVKLDNLPYFSSKACGSLG